MLFMLIGLMNPFFAQESSKIEPWKEDIQILLNLPDEDIDGMMGRNTFNALKKFAEKHDLTDVVLRGDFEDIGSTGFRQYMMKYHQYWMRELKNHQIIDDALNKEYLRQAEETLYSFEIAIQNAQLEVDRLTRAKSRAKRKARENNELDVWDEEKKEADRLITALSKAVHSAEEEAEKWMIERLRAKRLAEEEEQLARLDERKVEAAMLTQQLEDVITLAKREVDRLVEENRKLEEKITTHQDTESIARQLREELAITRSQLDSLGVQRDSLAQRLAAIESGAAKLEPKKKKKWYKRILFFWK